MWLAVMLVRYIDLSTLRAGAPMTVFNVELEEEAAKVMEDKALSTCPTLSINGRDSQPMCLVGVGW
jgi:hypothetical protein